MSFSQDEGYIDSTMIRDPQIAWKLGFIPGFGQFYNGKYLKAIGFIAGEYIAVTRFNEFKKTNSISRRNTYAWWIVGLYVLNILDAYVDAHLSTFPIRRLESSNDVDSLRVPIE
jgi:hypothetical protein